MGRIADIARSNIPIIWDALSNDSRVGDPTLDAREAYVTNLIFGDTLTDLEQDALAQLVADYAGMKLAVDVIDVSIDFWMVQSETATTQQPVEIESYPERLKSLMERKKALLVMIANIEPLIVPLIPSVLARSTAPLVSTIDDELLTPNPQDMGRKYAEPEV